ncbi:MAG: hypothetical protein WC866_02250 [Patescibacteria group bacterium]|jgi:hypothetical protein
MSSLDGAASIAHEGGADSFTVRVVYSGHESQVTVPGAESLEVVVQSEIDRLEFLSRQFSPDDSMEAPVHQQFLNDLQAIRESGALQVRWVQYHGYPIEGSVLMNNRAPLQDVSTEDELGSVSQALVTDWTQDAWWTPAGGTSTIYTSGTLQKFWLDSSSKSIINNYSSGLEMDTVVQGGSSNATCSTNGVSSNMPGYYADTEFLDGGGNTNCSVGTVNSSQLQTWTLYWTWHPFGSFNTSANPYITVMYQPKSWCWWVVSTSQCEDNKPWCMCNMSQYTTEWLISYNYNDRPGQETSWTKN